MLRAASCSRCWRTSRPARTSWLILPSCVSSSPMTWAAYPSAPWTRRSAWAWAVSMMVWAFCRAMATTFSWPARKRACSPASLTMSAARLWASDMVALAWVCAVFSRRSASLMSAEARSSCTGSIFLSSLRSSVSSSRSTLTSPGLKMGALASSSMAWIRSMMS